MIERTIGVALLAHGSGRGRCTAEGLQEITSRLADRLRGSAVVRVAFFEFLQPTLQQAILGEFGGR